MFVYCVVILIIITILIIFIWNREHYKPCRATDDECDDFFKNMKFFKGYNPFCPPYSVSQCPQAIIQKNVENDDKKSNFQVPYSLTTEDHIPLVN